MAGESLAIGFAAGFAAASTLAALIVVLTWRLRAARVDDGTIIERLQAALLAKIKDIPSDDLEKVREYIREIESLEPQPAASEARNAERLGSPAPPSVPR